jgi:hypothetical protein
MNPTPTDVIKLGLIVERSHVERIAERIKSAEADRICLDFRATQEFARGALSALATVLESRRGAFQILGLSREHRRLLVYLGVHGDDPCVEPDDVDGG